MTPAPPQSYRPTSTTDYSQDTIRWSAEYLLKTYVDPSAYVAHVGDQILEAASWGRPEDAAASPRPVTLLPTTSSLEVVDVAANVASGLASSAVVMMVSDLDMSTECLTKAKEAYAVAVDAVAAYDPENMAV